MRGARRRAAALLILLALPAVSLAPGAAADPSSDDDAIDPSAAISVEATEWVRDYWRDPNASVLVEDAKPLGVPADALGHELQPGGTIPLFELPPGRIVAPGTTRVDVTVWWDDHPTTARVEVDLNYATAAWTPVHAGDNRGLQSIDIQNGDTVTIPVNATAADAPFEDRSMWWFRVDFDGDPVGTFPDTTVHLRAIAHRARELPLIYEAPDPWQDGHEIVLVDGEVRSNGVIVDTPETSPRYVCPNGCDFDAWYVRHQALVPPDADRIEATVQWTWAHPSKVKLFAVAGETLHEMDLVEEGPDWRTYALGPMPHLADSPWQSRSRWVFFGEIETAGEVDLGAYSNEMVLDARAVRFGSDEPSVTTSAGAFVPAGAAVGLGTWGAVAIGGLVVLAAGAAALRTRAPWLAALMYNRIRRNRLLDHPARDDLVRAIDAEPGIHMRELARRTGLSMGNLEHHLGKLLDGGLVDEVATGAHRCFFLAGAVDRELRRALVAVKSEGARRVLAAACAAPGASVTRVADEAGIALSTASHHVARLVEVGVLGREDKRAGMGIRPTALGERLARRLVGG